MTRPTENQQTVEALYDPGTHEEIRRRFQAAEDAEGIPPCFHSKVNWTCIGCLWGQLERSEYVISDYRAALRDLVAQTEALTLLRRIRQWDALNPPPEPVPAPFGDLPYWIAEIDRLLARLDGAR